MGKFLLLGNVLLGEKFSSWERCLHGEDCHPDEGFICGKIPIAGKCSSRRKVLFLVSHAYNLCIVMFLGRDFQIVKVVQMATKHIFKMRKLLLEPSRFTVVQ